MLWAHPWVTQHGRLQPLLLEHPMPPQKLVEKCFQEIAARTDIDLKELQQALSENRITRHTASFYLLLDKEIQSEREREKENG